MKKKVKSCLCMLIGTLLLVSPITAYAKEYNICSAISFYSSINTDKRTHFYSDLGFNEKFQCNLKGTYTVNLRKVNALVDTNQGAKYSNQPTNRSVRMCYRWKNINNKSSKYYFSFSANNNTYAGGGRAAIEDSQFTVVSEE